MRATIRAPAQATSRLPRRGSASSIVAQAVPTSIALGRAGLPRRSCRVLAIRQVAALPYRTRKKGRAVDVLLVTSRETKRWVVPKGNLGAKTAPHAGAARE